MTTSLSSAQPPSTLPDAPGQFAVRAHQVTDEHGDAGMLLDLLARGRPAWTGEAACRQHPEVNFFPLRGEDSRQAKALCRSCPVRETCRDWALEQGDNLAGIWGGLTPRERRRQRAGSSRRGVATSPADEVWSPSSVEEAS